MSDTIKERNKIDLKTKIAIAGGDPDLMDQETMDSLDDSDLPEELLAAERALQAKRANEDPDFANIGFGYSKQ